MRVPPGVEGSVFAEAIGGFETAVGRQWVYTSEEDGDLYKDAYSPFWGEPEERLVSAAGGPAGGEPGQRGGRGAHAPRAPVYPILTSHHPGDGRADARYEV